MRALVLWTLLLAPMLASADPYVDGGWQPLGEVALSQAKVEQATGSLDPIRITEIENPAITENRYLVAGEVRYFDATGFLEMWSVFGEQRFFTRTLGETGPMAKLAGTSEWRPFMLPFNAESGLRPDRLEINVVLTGGGTAELRGLQLYQTDAALQTPAEAFRGWFTDKKPAQVIGEKKFALILAGIVLFAAAIVWIGWIRRKRAQRELRKMTAADIS